MTLESVQTECTEKGVAQIYFLFSDVLGGVKGLPTPVSQLDRAVERGIVIDGSSVAGYARIEESDYRARPDLSTFRILPWKEDSQTVAIALCDVITPDGQPFEGDPRHVLRRVLAEARVKGWTVNAGPEAEFFLFGSQDPRAVLDTGGYYDLVPGSRGLRVTTKIEQALKALGIDVEAVHHEVAPSQYEIDMRYTDALAMADQLLVYRWVVRAIASMEGCHATFMPKPIAGQNGSGMHVHLSLANEAGNLFYDEAGSENGFLSPMALQFLSGILKYAPEIAAVTNPSINSYKRLVPGYEAPVYICWGTANRSALVRVPGYEPGRPEATRIEARFPDPSCNPYLAFACLIGAGLAGIREKLTPPDRVEDDVYHLSESTRRERGIGSLPGDLDEALTLFGASTLCRSILGDHVFEKVAANAQSEITDFRLAVTDWELSRYLGRV